MIKLKAPLFFSPSTQKKHTNIIKLNIEPKKIYQQTEYNLSKKKIKQKINLGNLNTNSKLFLKKNMTQNISALNFTESNIAPDNKVLKNIGVIRFEKIKRKIANKIIQGDGDYEK